MSNIYEALEHYRKEVKVLEKPADVTLSVESTSKISKLAMEEEMTDLFQSINALLPDSQKKIIQFIGSREGEGTSTIIREFARVSDKKFGKSVLLLDAVMYEPSQHLFFKIKPEYSLEDVISDNKPIDKALCQVGNSRLFVSTISKQSFSTLQVFDLKRNNYFWENIKQQFDLILIDSPPATTSSDGLTISSMVDGVVLVLEAEKTRWPLAKSIKDKIIRNGGKVLGIVFNKRRHHIPEFIYKRL